MKCKKCNNEIPDGSIYCNYCGVKQITERRRSAAVSVPAPRQLPSGSWFIQLRVKGQSVAVTESTERECVEKARAIKAGLLKPGNKSPLTLEQAIDKYIAANSEVLSPSTIRGYETIKRNRFKQYMQKPLKNITDWQKVINEDAPMYAPKTMQNSWGLVSTVLRYLCQPVPDINLPQAIKSERPYFTPEQITMFVDAVKGKSVEIPALLALHSLRRSEICALTWDNIDLTDKKILVKGAAVPDKNNKIVMRDANKTIDSQRTVPIMIPALTDALEAAPDKTGLIVKCTPNNIYVRINHICSKAGLPEVGTHGLRHSFASLGFHLRIPPEIICLWGGWSSDKTVKDIYTHLYKEDIAKNETAMSGFYSGEDGENANENANTA